MNLLDHLQVGPFRSAYHCGLIDENFKTALVCFLDREIVSVLDGPIGEVEGTFVATYGSEAEHDPPRLFRDIFSLDVVIYGAGGASDLKADIVYDSTKGTFSPRRGKRWQFYVWTPSRKLRQEEEKASIQRLVDDVKLNRPCRTECPICRDDVSIVNDHFTFVVRCRRGCFDYNYHKDENGRFVIGHFSLRHPILRA